MSFALLCITVATSLAFLLVVPMKHPLVYEAGVLAVGGALLIVPGLRWVRNQKTGPALFLFNRACFYPLAVCVVVAVLVIL